MVVTGGLKESRAPRVKVFVMEQSLDEVILDVVSTTEAIGVSVMDEALLEEASRYSFSEPHSLLLLIRRFCENGVGGLKMRGVFWNQMIREKYGEEQRGWCSKEVRDGYGVGLWKAIRRK